MEPRVRLLCSIGTNLGKHNIENLVSIANAGIQIRPLPGLPMVQAGDDLVALVEYAMQQEGLSFDDGDVLVVAQKIVSKAEGRVVALSSVDPSRKARDLAAIVDKDPRLVQLILDESTAVIRSAPSVLIVRHKSGLVCANAGIDQSNVNHDSGPCALLLPEDADRSAKDLREQLEAGAGRRLGVLVCDSINRPWRLGTVGVCIGSSGLGVLDDRRGETDIYGRTLAVTMSGIGDSIATAANLVMGETTEKVPVAIVRGASLGDRQQTARDCIRPAEQDLFL